MTTIDDRTVQTFASALIDDALAAGATTPDAVLAIVEADPRLRQMPPEIFRRLWLKEIIEEQIEDAADFPIPLIGRHA